MKKKKLMSLLTVGVLCVVLAGCGDEKIPDTTRQTTTEQTTGAETDNFTENSRETDSEETTEEPEEAQEVDYDTAKAAYMEKSAEDLVSEFITNQEEVSEEEYINLLSNWKFHEFSEDDYSLQYDTGEVANAVSLLRDNEATLPGTDVVIGAFLDSEYPQLRAYAFSNMSSLFGVSDQNRALAVERLKEEEDPKVIKAALSALGNEGAADPEVGTFLLEMSKHEDAIVRRADAYALNTSWNIGLDGAVDTIITLIQDEDQSVRRAAAQYSGKLNDEAVIPYLVEILNNEEEADIHDAAIDGLCYLWYDYPFHENTSEAAYNATMDYLRKTPRTDKIPAWNSLSSFRMKADSSFDAWKEKATYYNPDEIVDIMKDIIADPDCNWLGRNAAVDVIASHGTKEQLEGLESLISSLDDDKAQFIQDNYEKALEKLAE